MNPLEDELLAVWRAVFQTPDLGPDDDFHELGGHSLLAFRLAARIQETLGLRVRLGELLEARTVRRLAAGLCEAATEAADNGLRFPTPAAAVPGVDTFPLSSGQERLWFVEQLEPGNRAYMFQCVLRFTGPLDVPALEQALTDACARHGALRATFHARDGRPYQRIHSPRPMLLPVLDLSRLPPAERVAESRRLIEGEVRRPFDLAEGPIVRWMLFRLGPEEHVLLHHEHHLVHDGWSFRLFVGEVLQAYAARVRGMPASFAEPAPQFGDFALGEAAWLQSEAAERQLAFWKARLRAGEPPLPLPFDRPRPARQSLRGASFREALPLGVCRAARDLGRRNSVSLYVVLLAAFQALMRKSSGQSLIATGCGVANRRSHALESIVGMFVNNIVLQSELSANPTFLELVRSIHRWSIEAQENSDVPFDRVVRVVGEPHDASRNPLFQVMFNEHAAPIPEASLPNGLRVALEEAVSNGSAKFDLNVIAMPHSPQLAALGSGLDPDSITLLWEFSTDLFERATVERLARDYAHLLEAAVGNPSIRIDDLPLRETHPRVRATVTANAAEAPAHASATDAARTPIEETLIGIWKSVLGVACVGPDDSFFDLGGHSLLAMRIVAQIESQLGKRVKLRTFFEAPTVRGLAEKLR